MEAGGEGVVNAAPTLGAISGLPMRFLCPALVALVLAACGPRPATAPARPDPMRAAALTSALAADLDAVRAMHPGVLVAVAVRDRSTGVEIHLGADSVIHAASTMKVPVMVELFRQAGQGEIDLDTPMRVDNRFRSIVDGSEFVLEADPDDSLSAMLGRDVSVRDLNERMITVSSNLATNLLIGRVDARRVQATMERLGTRQMQVRRGVEDGKAFAAGLNNVTTARDLALVLDRLAYGEAVSPAADAEMRAVMRRQRYNEQIPAGLPPGTPVAHKTGWITRHAHDAAIVEPAGQAPYVLVVLTKGFADKADADRVIADVARRTHTRLRG